MVVSSVLMKKNTMPIRKTNSPITPSTMAGSDQRGMTGVVLQSRPHAHAVPNVPQRCGPGTEHILCT